MARIRTIKPEFWSDEKLAPMDVHTRLLFLALISMADDCGRLLDSVWQIVAFVHPETDEAGFANASRDVRESLAKLSGAGRIVRGATANGQRVVQIANWERHQKVDHPNKLAALPQIVEPEPVTEPRETLARDSREIRENGARHSRLDLRSVPVPVPVPVPSSDSPKSRESAASRITWLTPFAELWTLRVGPFPYGRAAKPLRAVVDLYGAEAALAGLAAYLAAPRHPDKPVKLEYFAADAKRWIDGPPAGRPEDMSPSERLRAAGLL